jgi:hypothetical protein
VQPPQNMELPFFAYGLFKPGQLAYFQLWEFVSEVINPVYIKGTLLVRDGLPLLDLAESGYGRALGALLLFRPDRTREAYDRLSTMEPDKQYIWAEGKIDGVPVNVLEGRYLLEGADHCEYNDWNGWDDPLFKEALEVVKEALVLEYHFGDLKTLFRLQMAYLLLWSSIERYISLRYYLGNRVIERVNYLAHEPAFSQGLLQHVKNKRAVHRSDKPTLKEILDPESPEKAVGYYYQIRCNITHRGKASFNDYDHLKYSLTELLPIFCEVLRSAEREAINMAQTQLDMR